MLQTKKTATNNRTPAATLSFFRSVDGASRTYVRTPVFPVLVSWWRAVVRPETQYKQCFDQKVMGFSNVVGLLSCLSVCLTACLSFRFPLPPLQWLQRWISPASQNTFFFPPKKCCHYLYRASRRNVFRAARTHDFGYILLGNSVGFIVYVCYSFATEKRKSFTHTPRTDHGQMIC